MRRVVVTGMGVACPLGLGVEHVWRRLINSESGIGAIQSFDTKDLPCKIAGQVPIGSIADGKLDLSDWIPVKDQKKMDRFIHFAMAAGSMAIEDSGWRPETEEDRCATGVMIGSGIGGLETIFDAALRMVWYPWKAWPGSAYRIAIPPYTCSVAPVTHPASSEAR